MAYIDPGSGSFLLQLLIGLLVAIVTFFRSIVAGLRRSLVWLPGFGVDKHEAQEPVQVDVAGNSAADSLVSSDALEEDS